MDKISDRLVFGRFILEVDTLKYSKIAENKPGTFALDTKVTILDAASMVICK